MFQTGESAYIPVSTVYKWTPIPCEYKTDVNVNVVFIHNTTLFSFFVVVTKIYE